MVFEEHSVKEKLLGMTSLKGTTMAPEKINYSYYFVTKPNVPLHNHEPMNDSFH
jgi:hypothetical protein